MAKNVRAIKRRSELTGVMVREAVQDYLEHPHVKKLQKWTRVEYEQELGVFANWCETHVVVQKNKKWIAVGSDDDCIYLHQVNDHVVFLFVEHLKTTRRPARSRSTEMSTSTLSGYVKVIKTFLNWCLLDEQYSDQIKAITVQRIEKPVIIETIIEPFTPDEIALLFKACDKEESEHLQMRDRAILSVLLDTGLRATELCTLTIGHVSLDPKDAYVKVFGKGRKWGEVGLGSQARLAVQKYIKMFREPTIGHEIVQTHKNLSERQLGQLTKQEMQHALLFVNRSGQAMTKSGLYRMVDRLGKWAGIQGVRCSPHTFRHTFSVLFILNGGDILTLSKLLRHSSVRVTELYLKSLEQSFARRGAKSVLDNL